MAVAEKMCDYVFMICKGKKVLDGTMESIQDQYRADTIRVRVRGNGDIFSRLKGIDKLNDFGQFQELRLTDGTDSQTVLNALAAEARVELFEVARPSLHDIFVRIAGPQSQETNNA